MVNHARVAAWLTMVRVGRFPAVTPAEGRFHALRPLISRRSNLWPLAIICERPSMHTPHSNQVFS